MSAALASRYFIGPGGNRLAADEGGPSRAPAVVLLHGGGQTRHAWRGALRILAEAGYHAVSLDLRGHGDSDWAADGDYTTDALVGDLRAVAAALGRRPALVGASLGGVASLIAVGEDPGLATALVLVDVAPRLEAKGVAHIHQFMVGHLDGFATLDEAADAIAAYNPLRPRTKDIEGLKKNLRLRDDGRWHWHWDPRFVAGDAGAKIAAISDRMTAAAAHVRIPALLVRGRQSDVVSLDGAAELRERIPHLEFSDIEGAGHMVAGDRNDAFNGAVLDFLARHHPLPRL